MRLSTCMSALLVTLCVSLFSYEAGALVPNSPCLLKTGLTSANVCPSKRCNLLLQGTRAATRLHMMGDKRDPTGGDEEGKSQNDGPVKKGQNSSAPHVFMPSEVSGAQLQYLAYQFQLKQAIMEERYEDAAKLKMEIDELDHQETEVVIKKVLKESKRMHENASKMKIRSESEKLEKELQMAILEEDYVQAKDIAQRLQTMKGKSNGGKRLPILRQIDMVWLESEIGSRVAEARSKEQDRLQDPVTRLEHELRRALEDDDFESAARLRDRLHAHHLQRDVRKMNRDLTRQISFKKAEYERLRKNPERLLNQRLQDAVNAEDFEEARRLANQIREVELKKMYEALHRKVKERLLEENHKTESAALDEALEQSIAEEDFEKAKEIRDTLAASDEFLDLRDGLELAEKEGRFEEAQAFKSALIEKYIQILGAPLLQAMGYQYKAPAFRVGQPVYHKMLGFRGVVIGWHDACRASEPWIQHFGIDGLPSGREQRFYHVLPDTRDVALTKTCEGKSLWIGDCGPAFLTGKNPSDKLPFLQTCYIAEDLLDPWTLGDNAGVLASMMQPIKTILAGGSPIHHPLIPHYFISFRAGRYRADRKINSIVHYHMPEWKENVKQTDDPQ